MITGGNVVELVHPFKISGRHFGAVQPHQCLGDRGFVRFVLLVAVNIFEKHSIDAGTDYESVINHVGFSLPDGDILHEVRLQGVALRQAAEIQTGLDFLGACRAAVGPARAGGDGGISDPDHDPFYSGFSRILDLVAVKVLVYGSTHGGRRIPAEHRLPVRAHPETHIGVIVGRLCGRLAEDIAQTPVQKNLHLRDRPITDTDAAADGIGSRQKAETPFGILLVAIRNTGPTAELFPEITRVAHPHAHNIRFVALARLFDLHIRLFVIGEKAEPVDQGDPDSRPHAVTVILGRRALVEAAELPA